MTLVGGNMSIAKTNVYRSLVDQPLLAGNTNPATVAASYCQNMVNIAPARNNLDMAKDAAFGTPVAAVGNNLATFLGNRLSMSFVNLGCAQLRPDQPGHRHPGRERRRDRGHLQPDPADGDGRGGGRHGDQPDGRPDDRHAGPAAGAGTSRRTRRARDRHRNLPATAITSHTRRGGPGESGAAAPCLMVGEHVTVSRRGRSA